LFDTPLVFVFIIDTSMVFVFMMHPMKKVPMLRRNTRRAIQARRPLQPVDPAELDELEDSLSVLS
jgi:hypothetical protein